jgi:hypothetical protein
MATQASQAATIDGAAVRRSEEAKTTKYHKHGFHITPLACEARSLGRIHNHFH